VAAEAPNVTAKVSGLNTAADPERWSSADFRPYVDYAREVFGPHRLRHGATGPSRRRGRLLHPDLAGIRGCVDILDPEALWDVLGGTARRVYGLPAAPGRT
jgi:L-fuconolactonase